VPAPRRGPSATPRSAHAAGPRDVADPFDANDDSANCIRRGYAVERRGSCPIAWCRSAMMLGGLGRLVRLTRRTG